MLLKTAFQSAEVTFERLETVFERLQIVFILSKLVQFLILDFLRGFETINSALSFLKAFEQCLNGFGIW